MEYQEELDFFFEGFKELGKDFLENLYSPMFDKKMSELSDDELKKQIELWIKEEMEGLK